LSQPTTPRRSSRLGTAAAAAGALAVAVGSSLAGPAALGARPMERAARAETVTVAGAVHEAVRTATATVAGSVPVAGDGIAELLGSLGGREGLFGHSGKLRARFVAPRRALAIPALARVFGDSAARVPGVWPTRIEAERPLALVTLVPFSEKKRGRIGSYRMGSWPFERGTARGGSYGPFDGFIRVTPENQDTYVSEHFRLRDFLTKDQRAVWPKYLVLREPLLDKLELVIQELDRTGTPVRHVSVMSGFRTPQYNDQGVGAGGRAQNSRHQYGDAADVFVDNDRDGRLDDLDGNGRVDTRDVAVMVAAVERVERRYPDLVGGAGVYKATSAHGPFVHVDVRGSRARW
jgi:uncharacterized protein YcbK (DUF882 family)